MSVGGRPAMRTPAGPRAQGELRAAPSQPDREDGVRVVRGGGARPPTFLIVADIDADKNRFRVEPICRVLSGHEIQIAPSTYYARRGGQVTAADLDDASRANELVDLGRANRSLYGAENLHAAAWRAGVPSAGTRPPG